VGKKTAKIVNQITRDQKNHTLLAFLWKYHEKTGDMYHPPQSIGHTHITHQHFTKREKPPVCTSCGIPLTNKDIFTICLNFEREIRKSCLLYHIIFKTLNLTWPEPHQIYAEISTHLKTFRQNQNNMHIN